MITVCSITGSHVVISFFSRVGKKVVLTKSLQTLSLVGQYPALFGMLVSEYAVKTVRILVSERDAYLKCFLLPKGTVVTRDAVIQKAKEVIPETIDERCMDWRQVDIKGDGVGVQVYVVKKDILMPMFEAAAHAGITVECVEPPSFAMSHAFSSHESSLIVYPEKDPKYIFAVHNGTILEVMRIDEGTNVEDARKTMVAYIDRVWAVPLKMTAPHVPDPALGLAMKKETIGHDNTILNVPVHGNELPVATRPSRVIPLLIGIFAVEFIGVCIWFWVHYMGK